MRDCPVMELLEGETLQARLVKTSGPSGRLSRGAASVLEDSKAAFGVKLPIGGDQRQVEDLGGGNQEAIGRIAIDSASCGVQTPSIHAKPV